MPPAQLVMVYTVKIKESTHGNGTVVSLASSPLSTTRLEKKPTGELLCRASMSMDPSFRLSAASMLRPCPPSSCPCPCPSEMSAPPRYRRPAAALSLDASPPCWWCWCPPDDEEDDGSPPPPAGRKRLMMSIAECRQTPTSLYLSLREREVDGS